jgi:phosphopantothenoylcysteine decarboxylase/phosphopantothenate--cysteine ligase
MLPFQGKRILLGVSGGIAAYKVCYLVRELVKTGAEVRVIMTEAATKFVTPLTFSALSGKEVLTDMWDPNQSTDSSIGTRHIELANWADLYLVAPASANTIAKLTHGMADNLLTIVALACTRPIVLAPTMDADMFLNDTTQRNLAILRARGFFVIPPEHGEHASGIEGPGRLPDVVAILQYLEQVLTKSYRDLEGKKILITAGPTYEPLDPVRFLGNRSSGKMGFAIAAAASLRGALVTLISGPVSLETPRNVHRINVESAHEMHQHVMAHAKEVDAVVMAAAIADFTPAQRSDKKIKKSQSTPALEIKLTPTVDILGSLGATKNEKILVGFALETEEELTNAQAKLKSKNLDLIVLNSLNDEGAGFAADTNVVTLIDKYGTIEKLPKMSKFDVANIILDKVRRLFTTG